MPALPFTLQIFIIGCFGALAPEIVRLYNLRTKPKFKFTWSNFYILISLLFALLGGVVAVILPSTTYHGAFYAGIATPTLITTIQRNNNFFSSQENQDEASAQGLQQKKSLSKLLQDYWQAL